MNSSIICEDCGAKAPTLATACPKCGLKFEDKPDSAGQSFPLPPAAARQSGQETARGNPRMRFSGFGIRLAAYIIDAILLAFVTYTPLILVFGFESAIEGEASGTSSDMQLAILGLVPFLVPFLYFTIMNCSAKQGTLGKIAVGIKVVDSHGERLGYGRSVARYISKILSGLLLGIGFLMVLFTRRKQGLHDMIAGTLVIHK